VNSWLAMWGLKLHLLFYRGVNQKEARRNDFGKWQIEEDVGRCSC
jgi:hypothetical protein